MANASALGFKLSMNQETVWGTVVAAGGAYFRATGGIGKTTMQTQQSREMTRYENTDVVQTRVEGGGSYNFEASYEGTSDKEISMLLQSVFGNVYTVNVMKVAATRKSLTINEEYTDLTTPQFIYYPGSLVNSFRLEARTGDSITGSFGFVSKKGIKVTTTPLTTPTAANTNAIMSPLTALQTLNFAGVAVPSPVAFTMELRRTGILFPVINAADMADIVPGSFEASGSFSCYFGDAAAQTALLTDYLAFTERAITIKVGGVASKSYEFLFNKCNLTDGGVEGGGQNQPFIQTFNWTAKYDATETTCRVTRVP